MNAPSVEMRVQSSNLNGHYCVGCPLCGRKNTEDILPKPLTDEEIREKVEKYIKDARDNDWKNRQPVSDCMHDNCQGCKMGTCSGIHMIACPCRKCTPWC